MKELALMYSALSLSDDVDDDEVIPTLMSHLCARSLEERVGVPGKRFKLAELDPRTCIDRFRFTATEIR